MSWQKDFIKGSTWVLVTSNGLRILSLANTLVLARLLLPSDFGIMAMATAAVAFIEMLADFGLNVYLVQKKDLSREDLNSAWTLQVIVGLGVAIVLYAAIPYITHFYHEPRLGDVLRVLAAVRAISGFRNMGVVFFQKHFLFHREFLLRVPVKLMGIVISIYLAFVLRNYWALVWGLAIQQVMETFLSYVLSSYRPWFTVKGMNSLIHFSKWVYLNTTIAFLMQRGSDIILGKLLGVRAVGIYSVSFSLATLPTTEIADPISRVTYPSFVRLRQNLSELKTAYLKVAKVIAFVTIPLGVWVGSNAEMLVPFLLGSKWIDAIPVIGILCLAATVKTQQSNVGSLFLALGEPWTVSKVGGLRIALLIPLLSAFALQYGLVGAAWSVLLVEGLIVPLVLYLVVRRLSIPPMDILKCFARPVMSSTLMWAVMAALKAYTTFLPLDASLGPIVFSGLLGSIFYFATTLSLWAASQGDDWSPEQWIIDIVRSPKRLKIR